MLGPACDTTQIPLASLPHSAWGQEGSYASDVGILRPPGQCWDSASVTGTFKINKV